MKKIVLVLLAMVMLIAVPCLAFGGFSGHEGQIPLCQNNKTGASRFAPVKDIDPTANKDYEPYCNKTTETLIWINIHGIQGPPGVGSLGVYDGSGLFLGYLLELNTVFIPYGPGDARPAYTVSNPDVPGFFMVRLEYSPSLAAKMFGARYFTTEDCSGQPYLYDSSENRKYGWQDLFTLSPSTNDFYTIDTQVPPVRWSDLKAAKGRPDDVCDNRFSLPYPDRAAFPIKPVEGPIPLFNETLQYPIVLQPVN